MGMEVILASVLFLIVGAAAGFVVRNLQATKELNERKAKGDEIIDEAKEKAKDLAYKARKEAKEIAREEKQNLDKEISQRTKEIKDQEREITQKEAKLESKLEEADKEKARMADKEAEVEKARRAADEEKGRFKAKQEEIVVKLTEVAKLTEDQAKEELISLMEEDAKVDFSKRLVRLEEEAKEEAEERAKRIVGIAIQRFAGEHVAEKTISTVELPSDDVKGRLIGREGRNIRAFEQICGVDLIIDDTPEVVVISSFNVVRREIARQTILKLIADGTELRDMINESLPPAVLVLDRMLPGVSGDLLLKQIRSDPTWQHTPVVMISALRRRTEVSYALKGGANHYLPKPLDFSALVSTVEGYLH